METKRKCKVCGSEDIIYSPERGEYVCNNCGAVLEESVIDIGQEWRAFSAEQLERRARTGGPISVIKHDKGLGTQIGKGLTELYKVKPEKRIQYYRLTQWSKRLMQQKERVLTYALTELQRIASNLNLPKKIQERVATLYSQLIEKGLIRGRSIEAIMSALIFVACKEEGVPRTFDEIANVAGVSKREIGRAYRFVARQLNIRILPVKPEDYVNRFASLLGLSDKVRKKALEIIENARKKGAISGKGPTGVAAAVIYIASILEGERRTQKEIADKCKVTEVTIRNRYKEIIESLGIEEIISKKEKELFSEQKEEKKSKKRK